MAGFWQGVGDWFGFKPIDDPGDFFQDAASLLSVGMYDAQDNRFAPEKLATLGPVVAGIKSAFHSPEDTSEAAAFLGNAASYLGELMETEQNAAKIQAESNEEAAVNAWRRSELAADAAARRARELRRTSYQDAVASLRAAGLNPVLAAGAGISGSAVTAPQANAPASSASKADAINGADLLTAIASLLSGAGSLIKGLNPVTAVTNVDKNGAASQIFYHYGRK